MTERKEIAKADIFCRVYGKGPTVLLLHGFGEDGEAWNEVLPYLAGPYRILIPDIPGSGRSPYNLDKSSKLSIDTLADTLMVFLSEENEQQEKFILVGHSMGGYLALSIAARYPERIAGLVLVHSTAYADSEEKKANRIKSIEFIKSYGSKKYLLQSLPGLFGSAYKKKHPLKYQHWVEHYAGAFAAEVLNQYLSAMRDRPDRTELLKQLKAPVAFVIGKEDQAVPFQHSLDQAQMVSHPVICQLDPIGHMGMMEAPEAVGPFLQEYFLSIFKKVEKHL